jgi:hypothetical protein
MKLFPIVFLVLYVAEKRFTDLLKVLMVIIVATAIPLVLFRESYFNSLPVYYENLKLSQKMYAELMIVSGAGNHFGHSILNGIRVFFGGIVEFKKIATPYFIFGVLSYLFIAWFIIFKEKSLWKQVALIVISMCALPFTSTDYKLLHFFIPIFLFINTPEKIEKYIGILYSLMFILIIMPKGFQYFHGGLYATSNVFLTPLFMIILLIIILFDGVKYSRMLKTNSSV